MDATETWITTGAAARIAGRDIRTVRRWADTGIIRSRVSPYGRRQIDLASIIAAQQPPTRRRTRQPTVAAPETIANWAETAQDLCLWEPNRANSNASLEEVLIHAREITAAMADLEAAVLAELRRRDQAELEQTAS